MAGKKGKSGRPRKYVNETPEEKELRLKRQNRIYQKRFQDKKRAERKELALQIAKQKFKTEIEGGK
ncbi:MAG: hypothetical protein GX367_03655 [Bacteroidales bacterium]|nr:hypothetical protein [Bacteroidales bacterium]